MKFVMTIVAWNELEQPERERLLARPALETTAELRDSVEAIMQTVRRDGDRAVLDYGRTFDGRAPERLLASNADLDSAGEELDPALVGAIDTAIGTVTRFHEAARPQDLVVETAKGVTCEARWRALDPVGLYVPAGTAPLPSTAVMLGVPARLAGCRKIVLATPPGADGRADAAVRYIAHRLEIDTVLVAGGAQAVAAMAYGTESVPKVVRVFGPGNRFVAEAKRQAAQDPAGAAMDLPAGPSEVMVIADESTEADFIAMDLLSQAEHGPDSQVFLVTDSAVLARDVVSSLERLSAKLPRAETAGRALEHGAVIVVERLAEAVGVANDYAPEHLIIATDNARELCNDITSAGSVFLGHYTPEALGDYISGTNHVLPTGGWARSYAGLSLTDFMRRMTVQEATPEGLRTLGPDGARLAAHEGLDAHRLAIQMRLDRLVETSE
ncbi:histidinol dehydrogenase [Wenzhouxiangella sp. EGI_FJ10305]|uniref:histidinol dehydrogenase n=1 Tax=Wenzhouxiangella sp. EGI_FJ10305 TaxID=3243768 RepID=UPI0035E2E657